MPLDKLNKVDFHWFIVRTLPHQERKLTLLLEQHMHGQKNILEVYCPTHTTVSVTRNGSDIKAPLFAGYVFVLSTQQALTDFLGRYYPEGNLLYDRRREKDRKADIWTIPENQMRAFMDFNDNYADKVIILERPYTDYAFNLKTNEPNEIIRIVDGPLAGRTGYLARFRRDKRLVFNMKALDSERYYAVSIPNVWNLHVVRLHNADNDRQTVGTMKERAVDLLIGIIQGCGYTDSTLPLLYDITGYLSATPTLVGLCQYLFRHKHERLSQRIAQLDTDGAELILNLIRYEKDNPGYVKGNWQRLVIRPFLTPTPGMDMDGQDEATLRHTGFTEIIRRVCITEPTYYPDKRQEKPVTTTYYAHVGMAQLPHAEGQESRVTLFANWDTFLKEYFLTEGKANEKLVSGTEKSNTGESRGKDKFVSGTAKSNADESRSNVKLIESFRNYAPTLYHVLTGKHPSVKAIQALHVGGATLNVLAISNITNDASAIDKAKNELVNTCVAICTEINSTIHLSVWRRYLRTVWLHV